MNNSSFITPHFAKTNSSSEDIDIRGLINTIWRGKKLLSIIVILGFLLTLFLSSFIKTTYLASSNILIDGNQNPYQGQNIEFLTKILPIELDSILTEIEVLKSRNLAAKVVKRLNLLDDSQFQVSSKEVTDVLGQAARKKEKPFKQFSLDGLLQNSHIEIDLKDINEKDMTFAINVFLDLLAVTPIAGTSAVKVSFISNDPQKSANITNIFVDEYIKQRLHTKKRAQEKLKNWLDKRAEELRLHVLEADIKAEQFRVENNLILGKRDILSAEQISVLNNQLILSRTNQLNIKSRLAQIKNANDSSTDTKSSFNSLASSLIKHLNVEKIAAENSLSELSNRYGPKHPTIIKKQSELDDINQKIKAQLNKSKKTLQNDLEVARKQTIEIEKELNNAMSQNSTDSTALVKYEELKREAESAQIVLKDFLAQYKSIIGKNTLEDAGASILSYASAPDSPSSPDKKLILALGLFISFMLGLAITFLNEKIYSKFRTISDLESEFSIPCAGGIPNTRVRWSSNLVPYVLSHPLLPITEAVRNLRLGLKDKQTKEGEALKVISFLSSVKNESKTTTAVLMASLAAKAGERVILIDGNLRKPAVHSALEESNDTNLVDYLTGQKELGDVIFKDKDTGLDIIFGTSVPNNAFNLLSMNKLDTLISALRQTYDLVIIDTPACSEASDARLIEQLSDLSLYAVKACSTNDKTVSRNLSPFLNNQKNVALILTHKR